MKLQKALKSLALIATVLAFAMAGYGGAAAAHSSVSSASPTRSSVTKSRGIELAAAGFQLGQSVS